MIFYAHLYVKVYRERMKNKRVLQGNIHCTINILTFSRLLHKLKELKLLQPSLNRLAFL